LNQSNIESQSIGAHLLWIGQDDDSSLCEPFYSEPEHNTSLHRCDWILDPLRSEHFHLPPCVAFLLQPYFVPMPSVRPKLVEEGAPISGKSNGVVDVPMKTADNLYVVGASHNEETNFLQQANTSRSSLSMHVNSSHGMDSSSSSTSRRRSSAAATKGKASSLARAAKGTFIQDKAAKKPVVQTTFVVGGSSFQDEKKSSDSPMMDDSAKKRSSFITTSYQIPDNGNNAYAQEMDLDSPKPIKKRTSRPSVQPTAYVIGQMDMSDEEHKGDKHEHEAEGEVEKMEGVVDLTEKPPLCVLDGANIAYAYSKAFQGSGSDPNSKQEPDTRGIVVACDYFTSAGIRVLAVIPATWTHRDPHQKILKKLEEQGLLVEAPSRDDDDAYAITIARREDAKAREKGDGPGYVMSNDMFRDAIARSQEEGGGEELKQWLTEGWELEQGKTGPGRISFAFLDTGSMDDHGDKILDIMPNPRHPLIQFVEQGRHKS
jgi:Zc3h12a-like Ribonuclease NYN domain